MKYEIKLTMTGNFPSGIENDKFEVTERIYDNIMTIILIGKDYGNVKEIP